MWEKYMIEYSEKLYVIYNFVILPTITSKYIPKKNGKLNITIAANYKYNKNPIGLINAVSMMTKEERSKIVINWYGTTDIGEETISVYNESVTLIKTQKLEDIIHLNNSSKDIANIMNEADVVALFSKLEGLPNAICEGMMLGKPIIMTRVSDYKALVDNSNGFLCEWDNNYSIKDALIKASIIKKDDLLIMGYNSKLKANYLFSQETIMNDWAHIIELNK
jgi:glycosyltransferase involved in cell wall biosynthesis